MRRSSFGLAALCAIALGTLAGPSGVALGVSASASGQVVGSSTSSNAASPRKWLWTESYAEKILMKNLRIPCKYVRQTRAACDVAAAQARVDSWNASVAACNAKPLGDPSALSCLQFLMTTGHVVQTLENVKNGFKLQSAHCIGSGNGIRFPLLRCEVSVLDRDVSTNQPRTASGRIAVTTTGKATFRWVLI
jgi:hypothetical protein